MILHSIVLIYFFYKKPFSTNDSVNKSNAKPPIDDKNIENTPIKINSEPIIKKYYGRRRSGSSSLSVDSDASDEKNSHNQ